MLGWTSWTQPWTESRGLTTFPLRQTGQALASRPALAFHHQDHQTLQKDSYQELYRGLVSCLEPACHLSKRMTSTELVKQQRRETATTEIVDVAPKNAAKGFVPAYTHKQSSKQHKHEFNHNCSRDTRTEGEMRGMRAVRATLTRAGTCVINTRMRANVVSGHAQPHNNTLSPSPPLYHINAGAVVAPPHPLIPNRQVCTATTRGGILLDLL